jgi:hypothetical protein
MNDSPLNGDGDGFGSIGNVQLRQNIFQKSFYRVFADIQGVRDLFVRHAFDQFGKHLQLAGRKLFEQTP